LRAEGKRVITQFTPLLSVVEPMAKTFMPRSSAILTAPHAHQPSSSVPTPPSPAMQATWNGAVIASSDDIVMVEGNAYFPADALNKSHFHLSSHRSHCGWKGEAHYYDVVVDGQVNNNAAWFYPEPKQAAENIKGRVAFWRGVQVG